MCRDFIYACDALHNIIVRTQRNCKPGRYVVAKFIKEQLIKLNSLFLLFRVCGSGHSSLVALQPIALTEPNSIVSSPTFLDTQSTAPMQTSPDLLSSNSAGT